MKTQQETDETEETTAISLMMESMNSQKIIKAKLLTKILKDSLDYVSKDKDRQILHNIKIESVDNELKFIATDGRRLVVFDSGIELRKNEIIDFILGNKDAKNLIKFLSKIKKHIEVEIRFSDEKILIKSLCSEDSFDAIKMDMNYPNWQAVLPNENGMYSFCIDCKMKNEIVWKIREAIALHDLWNIKRRNAENQGRPGVIFEITSEGEFDVYSYGFFNNDNENLIRIKSRGKFIILDADFMKILIESSENDLRFQFLNEISAAVFDYKSESTRKHLAKIAIMPIRTFS